MKRDTKFLKSIIPYGAIVEDVHDVGSYHGAVDAILDKGVRMGISYALHRNNQGGVERYRHLITTTLMRIKK